MGDNKNPLSIAPKFDWTKPNLYEQFKIFEKKVKFAFDSQFKDSDKKVKIDCILNWLGDDAFLIYDNLTFVEAAHKDLPDKVLEAFSNYSNLRGIFFIHGILLVAFTPINSSHSLIFIIIFNVLLKNAISVPEMRS